LSLTVREEHRLRVFENRVLRRTSGLREEETIGWGGLHYAELHNSYPSTNVIKVIELRMLR
jgi:hypothetical protein